MIYKKRTKSKQTKEGIINILKWEVHKDMDIVKKCVYSRDVDETHQINWSLRLWYNYLSDHPEIIGNELIMKKEFKDFFNFFSELEKINWAKVLTNKKKQHGKKIILIGKKILEKNNFKEKNKYYIKGIFLD